MNLFELWQNVTVFVMDIAGVNKIVYDKSNNIKIFSKVASSVAN